MLVCTSCGAENREGARFCNSCGGRVMARYFETTKAIVERHGGNVEKFIGDAVMAVFGVPTVHEDDALRAVIARRTGRPAGAREALEHALALAERKEHVLAADQARARLAVLAG